MKSIFVFFVSLFLGVQFSNAQQMLGVEKGGLRLGFDLSRLGIYLFEEDRSALEFSLDLQLSQRTYFALELGKQKVSNHPESNYLYSSKGSYFTVGLDRILFELNKEGDNDILYLGLRYGFSSMSQRATFTIEDDVFGSVNGEKKDPNVSVHWVEAVFGVKVETLKNVFLGISTRTQLGVLLPEEKEVPHYIHAGFGNSENLLNVGITYSIYYRIPMYKLKQPSR